MSDIFISYAREDKERAAELAEAFARAGWTVWWDRDLIPGDKYEEVIGRQLAEAKAVVVLWSKTSVASGWVKDEARKGAQHGVLVPLLIDPVDLPLGFGEFHAADLSGWDGSASDPQAQALLRRVSGLIEKPVLEVRPTALQRLRYFYRRHRAAILTAALFTLFASVGYFALWPASSPGPGPSPSPSPLPFPSPSGRNRDEAIRLTVEGNKEAGESNYEGAIILFTEGVNKDASFPDVYYYRGQSFVSAGDKEEALTDFEKAVALNVREPLRRKAGDYIQKLRAPAAATPTPVASNSNGHRNANASLPPPTNANTSDRGDLAALQAQVNQMFSDDKDVRVESTTKLVIERKKDPRVVGMAVAAAAAHPRNLSGVINTLVLLENVDPAILKERRDEIVRLFQQVEGNGDITRKHIRNVENILNR